MIRKKDLDFDSRRNSKTKFFCCKCMRDIPPGHRHRWVHLVDGGAWVLHPNDEGKYSPDDGDCGLFPIGMDCARVLGLEWSIEKESPS